MKNAQETIQKILELAGFADFNIQADSENRRLAVFVNEGEWFKKVLPNFVSDIDYIVRLATKKDDAGGVFVDVNNCAFLRGTELPEFLPKPCRNQRIQSSEYLFIFMLYVVGFYH